MIIILCAVCQLLILMAECMRWIPFDCMKYTIVSIVPDDHCALTAKFRQRSFHLYGYSKDILLSDILRVEVKRLGHISDRQHVAQDAE